jgi:molybdopterin molybdotransferase
MTTNPIDRMPMKALDEAFACIDARIGALGPEEVAIGSALGRVLAQDVVATEDSPGCDRAGMDGLALRSDETVGASAYNPLSFRLSDRSEALAPGMAMQVRAGERLPAGADAIVPAEFTQMAAPGLVEVIEAVPAEHDVERQASHFARGTVLLRTGRCLRAADLGLLGAGRIERLAVIRRPRVAILSRVSEMEPAGPAGGLAMLHSLIERDGGRVVDARQIARSQAAIRQAITDADADLVLLDGGPERGRDRDAAHAFAAAGGLEIAEIALGPGGSVALGRITEGGWAFSMPAGLCSSFWAYEAVIGRAVRRLAGRDPAWPFHSRAMPLARKIVSAIGVTDICSIRCREDGFAEPLSGLARSDPRMVTEADGFVVVSEGSEGMSAGATVQVYLFDGASRQVRPESQALPHKA